MAILKLQAMEVSGGVFVYSLTINTERERTKSNLIVVFPRSSFQSDYAQILIIHSREILFKSYRILELKLTRATKLWYRSTKPGKLGDDILRIIYRSQDEREGIGWLGEREKGTIWI